MVDPEIEFLNDLLQEARLSSRYHLVLACTIGCLALVFFFSVLMSVLHVGSVDKDFSKSATVLASVIGLIPVRLYFGVRGQMAYYRFLKGQWQGARAQNNSPIIENLRNRIYEIGGDIAKKAGGS